MASGQDSDTTSTRRNALRIGVGLYSPTVLSYVTGVENDLNYGWMIRQVNNRLEHSVWKLPCPFIAVGWHQDRIAVEGVVSYLNIEYGEGVYKFENYYALVNAFYFQPLPHGIPFRPFVGLGKEMGHRWAQNAGSGQWGGAHTSRWDTREIVLQSNLNVTAGLEVGYGRIHLRAGITMPLFGYMTSKVNCTFSGTDRYPEPSSWSYEYSGRYSAWLSNADVVSKRLSWSVGIYYSIATGK